MAKRAVARDTWLYSNKPAGRKVQKAAADAEGRLEGPASEFVQRMLVAPVPKIIHLGGEVAKDGNVHVIRKMVPDYPASHQLKDPFEGLYAQGIALEPPLPPERLLSLSEENTLHSGCLMAKAYDSCGRGWDFVPKKGKQGDKKLLESEVPEKLRDAMELLTPDLTFGELLYQAAWEMDAIGFSVWEVVRFARDFAPGTYSQIGALYPIPSFTMRATVDPRRWVQIRAGRIRFFKKFGAKCEIDAETGQVYDWRSKADMEKLGRLYQQDPNRLASEVILFKSYTPRSLWYGIPKWISAIPTIAELTAIREFNVSWFASGGQTDYIVHLKAESIQVAQEMSKDLREQMQENAGRGHTNLVIAGTADTEMNVQKLGELLREGHFRFRRGDLAKEVLIAHNVPPYRIGWAETGSLAGNAAQEMLGAYKFGGIEPIQTIIEDRLRATLFDPDMGLNTGEFRFELADLELEDMEKELDQVIKKIDSMLMTPNQGREALGMEAVEPKPKKAVKPGMGENGEPIDAEDNLVERAAPPVPGAPAPAEGESEEPELDADGNPIPPKPGEEDEDEVDQAAAMNKFYYKGQPIGEKPEAPPMLGPDGKPMPSKPPFGGPPAPGGPAPEPVTASVDKSLVTIAEFEKTLRSVLREGPAVGNETYVQESAPSERRPSRRSRRQTKI